MRLKELRKAKRISQKTIAKKLNVSNQTILNWENGIYEPNIQNLIKLADIFNVSVDYLIERKAAEDYVNEICERLAKISKASLINFLRTELIKA